MWCCYSRFRFSWTKNIFVTKKKKNLPKPFILKNFRYKARNRLPKIPVIAPDVCGYSLTKSRAVWWRQSCLKSVASLAAKQSRPVRASCLSDRSSSSCQTSFRTFASIGVEQPAPNSRSPSRFALGVRHPLTADQAPPFDPIRRAGGMDVVGNMSAGS